AEVLEHVLGIGADVGWGPGVPGRLGDQARELAGDVAQLGEDGDPGCPAVPFAGGDRRHSHMVKHEGDLGEVLGGGAGGRARAGSQRWWWASKITAVLGRRGGAGPSRPGPATGRRGRVGRTARRYG